MSAPDLPFRIGQGFDAHRFEEGRPLVLGGVTIEHPRGLAGHSDADVLAHAVADALLGAMGLGDLGRHFPSNDPRWEGVDSLHLLARVAEMVQKVGGAPVQVDATLCLEQPKMAPHLSAMREKLADAIGLEPDRVSLKATTTDGMGFTGRGEGAAAFAVALVAVPAA
jgi:2-C-methyl-D-erythritol 2,4-cyclodiphosphate synthase